MIRNLYATLLCTTALLTLVSCLRESYAVKLTGPITPGEIGTSFIPEAALKPDKDWQAVGPRVRASRAEVLSPMPSSSANIVGDRKPSLTEQ